MVTLLQCKWMDKFETWGRTYISYPWISMLRTYVETCPSLANVAEDAFLKGASINDLFRTCYDWALLHIPLQPCRDCGTSVPAPYSICPICCTHRESICLHLRRSETLGMSETETPLYWLFAILDQMNRTYAQVVLAHVDAYVWIKPSYVNTFRAAAAREFIITETLGKGLRLEMLQQIDQQDSLGHMVTQDWGTRIWNHFHCVPR